MHLFVIFTHFYAFLLYFTQFYAYIEIIREIFWFKFVNTAKFDNVITFVHVPGIGVSGFYGIWKIYFIFINLN